MTCLFNSHGVHVCYAPMKGWAATVSLIGVTAVWGWTFVVVKNAIAIDGVIPFLAARFLLASVILLALWGRRLTPSALRAGALLGFVLATGYLLQTWGLNLTTATNSGLITGLFVIAAPGADRILFRTRFSHVNIAATVLSLAGMVLLTGWSPGRLAIGDLLTFGCAIAFGIHIALLSHYSPHQDTTALTTAQLLWVSIVFLAAWPAAGRPEVPPRAVWGALVITGVLASALAYFVQTAAQRHLSTARTAVILTMEPVFAGLFGFLLEGERLRGLQIVGAAVILGALVLNEILPALARSKRFEQRQHDDAATS